MRTSLVCFENSRGTEERANLLKLTRHHIVFELYSADCTLRVSEVISDLKILVRNKTVYSGRAVITGLVDTSTLQVCEVKLDDSWLDVHSFLPALEGKAVRAGFGEFLLEWHKIYRIIPAFKGIVADMHTFLADLRLWLDQLELGIRSSPSGDRRRLEEELARELGQATTPAIGALFENFEAITLPIDRDQGEQRAAHSAFAKRLLHPLLLSSPFLYRTFRKPLGYAGDYEMVNMICREPLEGSTLFAKMINLWFLRQPPAEAHRNRVRWLMERLSEVTASRLAAGQTAQILSLGCGPAIEVQQFLKEKHYADSAHFTLIDFNQETAEHVRSALEAVKRSHHRRTSIQVVRKSVNQILKEAGRTVQGGSGGKYDFVYCAGLFDYLSDQTCRILSNILYEWVAPGGLFVSTNVDASNPRRLTMEYIMDWHLIYRSGAQLAALKPGRAAAGEGSITADSSGVNVFYSVRKPRIA